MDEDSTQAFTLTREAVVMAQSEVEPARAIEQLRRGWIAEEALAIAFYCASKKQDDFEAAVRMAVNHDGDSDSTGAICGNLVGAHLGTLLLAEALVGPAGTGRSDRYCRGQYG